MHGYVLNGLPNDSERAACLGAYEYDSRVCSNKGEGRLLRVSECGRARRQWPHPVARSMHRETGAKGNASVNDLDAAGGHTQRTICATKLHPLSGELVPMSNNKTRLPLFSRLRHSIAVSSAGVANADRCERWWAASTHAAAHEPPTAINITRICPTRGYRQRERLAPRLCEPAFFGVPPEQATVSKGVPG